MIPATQSHNHEFLDFPKSFVWGVGTSAHQVEGDNKNNDWYEWEKTAGHIWLGDRSGKAAFGFDRFKEDADLAKSLGCGAYRLSIEWSRIEPKEGVFDEAALAHYKKVFRACHARGLRVMLTLHHFTNPLWFSARGGWQRWDAPKLFEQFTARVAKEYASDITWWITINEPSLYANLGFARGLWPPGKKSLWGAARVFFNMMRAHKRAYRVIHEIGDTEKQLAEVGVAMNMFSVSKYDHGLADLVMVRTLDWILNHSFFDFTRHYHDFIGVNYYFHRRLQRQSGHWLVSMIDARVSEQREASDIGWEIFPHGISDVLHDVWSEYHLPIYITENGLATDNEDKRARFIVSHLKEVYHTISSGVEVRGYFYWSLIDNFEWEKGFTPRFGLVHVDFKTGKRTTKPSAKVFSTIAHAGGISHRLLRFLGHGVHINDVV